MSTSTAPAIRLVRRFIAGSASGLDYAMVADVGPSVRLLSVIHSFIHSYSFNVQVDITQLQTDREARKEDRIFIYVAVCSS